MSIVTTGDIFQSPQVYVIHIYFSALYSLLIYSNQCYLFSIVIHYLCTFVCERVCSPREICSQNTLLSCRLSFFISCNVCNILCVYLCMKVSENEFDSAAYHAAPLRVVLCMLLLHETLSTESNHKDEYWTSNKDIARKPVNSSFIQSKAHKLEENCVLLHRTEEDFWMRGISSYLSPQTQGYGNSFSSASINQKEDEEEEL